MIPILQLHFNAQVKQFSDGYGKTVINQMRKWFGTGSSGTEFPLTFGRDFSGVVKQTGHGVSRFKPGDEVRGNADLMSCHLLIDWLSQFNSQ